MFWSLLLGTDNDVLRQSQENYNGYFAINLNLMKAIVSATPSTIKNMINKR